jgi:hypothetical protein
MLPHEVQTRGNHGQTIDLPDFDPNTLLMIIRLRYPSRQLAWSQLLTDSRKTILKTEPELTRGTPEFELILSCCVTRTFVQVPRIHSMSYGTPVSAT